jgi:hypothetical protein
MTYVTLKTLTFRRFTSLATNGYSVLTDPGSVPERVADFKLGDRLVIEDTVKHNDGHFDSWIHLYRSLSVPFEQHFIRRFELDGLPLYGVRRNSDHKSTHGQTQAYITLPKFTSIFHLVIYLGKLCVVSPHHYL